MTVTRHDTDALRAVLNDAAGARFISFVLEMCGVYRLSYEGEDTHATAFKEGARNVGLRLLALLDEADDEARLKLNRADNERSALNERRRDDA